MDLISTPKNPIPLGASTGFIEVRKGLRLRFASWQPVLRERRGTVCIFPGRAEYIEKYFEVVGELRRRGFAVAVLDWRGQGGSSRLTRNPLKGHVNDFAEYEEDLAHFMKAVVLPDCPAPYFALGHSMASMVLFSAAIKRGCWFTRMVLTAPMVKIAGLPMSHRVCRQLADGLTMIGFGKRPVPGDAAKYRYDQPFEGNMLTSDRERYLRNLSVLQAAPEIAIEAPTIGWLKAALNAIERVGGRKIRAARPRAGADVGGKRRSGGAERGDRRARHPLACRLADRAARLAPRDPARARHHPRAILGGFRRLRARRRARASPANRSASSRRPRAARLSPAATMRPPSRGSPPSQEVTMPPARSTIGIRGRMSNGFKPGLDDEVDVAHRQQAVIVAIAAEAPETHGTA